ncbi:uncharacterized protein LOC127702835 [Mytilus californianus]|uniref:uncharacterized protein LOC127702835 n=1 Tax=Mytilus californianus TaxID=6549 RepID=UPI0022463793|nr:uncharacterized protein LOC127702835 [Mytilus californianus]
MKSGAPDGLLKLKDAKPEDLPLSLRQLVRRTGYGEHMCCRNKPVGLITKTRSAKRVTNVKEEVKVSSGSCGLFGTGTCNKYDYKYHEVITYVTEYYKDINYLGCPDRHVVCCNYYIMVSKKCVYLDDLHAIAQHMIG